MYNYHFIPCHTCNCPTLKRSYGKHRYHDWQGAYILSINEYVCFRMKFVSAPFLNSTKEPANDTLPSGYRTGCNITLIMTATQTNEEITADGGRGEEEVLLAAFSYCRRKRKTLQKPVSCPLKFCAKLLQKKGVGGGC
jgi:hypothetical protein